MSKNFASIWASTNDSSALEQKFFLKLETSRGVLTAPTGADFFYTLAGGAIKFARPANSSPIRSGRHNSSVIQEKDTTNWSFPAYVMINEALGSFSTAEIDPAVRVLWKSLLGKETVSGSALTYDSGNPPDITFSLFETGDLWSNQAPGCFVDAMNLTAPGDGQTQLAWSGMGKTMYRIGVAKSVTDNNAGNDITVATSEGKKFEIGGMVMIILANGTTRSADTPDGSPRTVTNVVGDVVTVSGAVLAAADGSGVGAPVYLTYYEPTTPVAINNPLTGLVGDVTIGGITVGTCVRSFGLNITNNHEAHNFCWGERGLSGPLFTPGGRLNVETTMELNMSHQLLEFIKDLKNFTGVSFDAIIGETTGRRGQFTLPKIPFAIPEIAVPETGSIPVTFTGLAEQTGIDLADEITAAFK